MDTSGEREPSTGAACLDCARIRQRAGGPHVVCLRCARRVCPAEPITQPPGVADPRERQARWRRQAVHRARMLAHLHTLRRTSP